MFIPGFSIYTGLKDYSLEENLKYLHLASKHQMKIAFSSAHINEAVSAWNDLEILVEEADKLGIKMILDISKPMMDKYQIPEKLYSLRLDYGFTQNEIVKLSNESNYKIELNASTISKKYLDELVEMGLNLNNIRASFNYYPKLYTGHNIAFLQEKISIFMKYQIPILAFIPSHIGFRPPMYEGLPTVEDHRLMSYELAIEELKAIGIDEIAIGDAFASEEEMAELVSHNSDQLILPFTPVDNLPSDQLHHLSGVFKIRQDYNDLILRMSSHRSENHILPFNTVVRNIYDITIDNDNFNRYRGEINVQISILPRDPRVNVVGKTKLTNVLIEALKKGVSFKFAGLNND